MGKRIAIAGHSEEGLSLIPLLEANPEIEVCALFAPDPLRARAALQQHMDPFLAARLSPLITADPQSILRTPGLTAVVDAELPADAAGILHEAPDRGIQVTTPLIARLLYAFGPIDGARKPDLLQALAELLESYNLTIDRDGLLSRILQIAVGSTGADRGSLMLYDPQSSELHVEVAIGIEKEVLPKIRVAPGEGIAGLAFSRREPILLRGKADHERYQISRERSDVAAAISAPLIHGDQVLGVLNLSHATDAAAFDEEDLDFVANLARVDAKIITRADEYHGLLQDSASLRELRELREILASPAPLDRRLSRVCRYVVDALEAGVCHLYLTDPERSQLVLRGSSAPRISDSGELRLSSHAGLHGWSLEARQPLVMCESVGSSTACFAAIPLHVRGQRIGVLSFDGLVPHPRRALLRERVISLGTSLASVLHDVLRELRMEREARRSAALTDLAARLGSSFDIDEVHRLVTEAAAGLVDAAHAVLRLEDADGALEVRSYFGSASDSSAERLLGLEESLALACLRERSSLRVTELHGEGWQHLGLANAPALVVPVRHQGRTVGTLSVLGNAAGSQPLNYGFDAEDQDTVERLSEHAHTTLMVLEERERSRTHERFDVLTGLPNGIHLAERLEEEIARCSGTDRPFTLVRVTLGALDEICAWMEVSAAAKLLRAIATELRASVREFDVVARCDGDTFEILMPEPDRSPSEVIAELARRVCETVRREAGPDAPETFPLRFGYAQFPEEGTSANELNARVRQPRVTSD
jgi:diguanylate cyclase (GGDEF)-like protein